MQEGEQGALLGGGQGCAAVCAAFQQLSHPAVFTGAEAGQLLAQLVVGLLIVPAGVTLQSQQRHGGGDLPAQEPLAAGGLTAGQKAVVTAKQIPPADGQNGKHCHDEDEQQEQRACRGLGGGCAVGIRRVGGLVIGLLPGGVLAVVRRGALAHGLGMLHHLLEVVGVQIEAGGDVHGHPAQAVQIDLRPGVAVLIGQRDRSGGGFRGGEQIALGVPGGDAAGAEGLHGGGGVQGAVALALGQEPADGVGVFGDGHGLRVVEGVVLQHVADALGGVVDAVHLRAVRPEGVADELGQAGIDGEVVVVDKAAVDALRAEIGALVVGLGQDDPAGLLQQLAGERAGHVVEGVIPGAENAAAGIPVVLAGVKAAVCGGGVGQVEPGAVSPHVVHGDGAAGVAGVVGGQVGVVLGQGIEPLLVQPGQHTGVVAAEVAAGQGRPDAVLIASGGKAPQVDGLFQLGGDGEGGVVAGEHGVGLVEVAVGQVVAAIAQLMHFLSGGGVQVGHRRQGLYDVQGQADEDEEQQQGVIPAGAQPGKVRVKPDQPHSQQAGQQRGAGGGGHPVHCHHEDDPCHGEQHCAQKAAPLGELPQHRCGEEQQHQQKTDEVAGGGVHAQQGRARFPGEVPPADAVVDDRRAAAQDGGGSADDKGGQRRDTGG